MWLIELAGFLSLFLLFQLFRAIPHNSKCRYGERAAADAKPKAQIILDVLSSILATPLPCPRPRIGSYTKMQKKNKKNKKNKQKK